MCVIGSVIISSADDYALIDAFSLGTRIVILSLMESLIVCRRTEATNQSEELCMDQVRQRRGAIYETVEF